MHDEIFMLSYQRTVIFHVFYTFYLGAVMDWFFSFVSYSESGSWNIVPSWTVESEDPRDELDSLEE